MRWADRLAKAVKRGKFTRADKDQAADWGKCAVGEAPNRLTKAKKINSYGETYVSGPDDDVLFQNGSAFADAVGEDRVGDAVTHFLVIRARLKELKTA